MFLYGQHFQTIIYMVYTLFYDNEAQFNHVVQWYFNETKAIVEPMK